MSDQKDIIQENGIPAEQQDSIKADSPVAEAQPPRRRRRADRYVEEAQGEAEAPRREAALPTGSETAREVANRYRQRQTAGAAESGSRPASRPRPTQRVSLPQEQIGYPSGRMGMSAPQRARMSEAGRARLAEENRARVPAEDRESRQPSRNQAYAGRPVIASRPEREQPRRNHPVLIILIIALLLIGAVLIAALAMPEDSLIGGLRSRLAGDRSGGRETPHAVLSFTLVGQDRAEAPAEVSFLITTEKGAEDIRLLNEQGDVLPVDHLVDPKEDSIQWDTIWYAAEPYEGLVQAQALYGGVWMEPELTVPVEVLPAEEPAEDSELPVVFATEVPTATPVPAATAVPTAMPDPEEFGDGEVEGLGEDSAEAAGDPDDPDLFSGADPDDPEKKPENAGSAATSTILSASYSEKEPAEEGEAPEDVPEEPSASEKAGGAEAPAEEKAETPEEPVRRLFTVSAAESASPGLISTAQIYNGNRKVNEYARSDKEKIHMPVLGEYTKQKMGILTFRGDAFRQNAAIGTVKGMDSLTLAWTAEAGSIKGSGQVYYGIGWVGQPAIVKWSKQVREQSEMYDSKKEKTSLKEVIVGGLDGRIYFLDLADGSATRNSIKLGFPMKGSPSVHPGGAPYMTVGQFARKMAGTTGKIGLRQYNLYQLKELSLIDGLDEKNNRPYNKIGSFETSALIDRTTGTLVTAGTNGMLYVIALNSEFDYSAGTYTQSPVQVALRTKAKGEKETATAVEASIAMYDRYVYYADMGGFLRCVDTNTMTTAWAVSLGDSVESTPALDWHGEEGLDLYAATELSLRKKGDAEVTCFDALSGETRWTWGVGVKKDTKNKTVSGFRASPVVGQNGLSGYVYYTVNNLSDAGQEQLGLDTETAALVALNREDGSLAWAVGLSGRGYSSPVAVYDEEGNGAIIQCAGDGSVLLLDGETGEERASLQIDGTIEASPAVYDGMMVIGTTEKNKNNIYGIRIE